MVCFVDDDIVCEGYSVSEEVYLLNHTEKTSTNPEASSSLSSPLLLIFFPQKASGIMLDLHASPQLTGTRFENPDWRKHLPSLKPIGLASMLTYACVGEDSGSADLIKIPHSGELSFITLLSIHRLRACFTTTGADSIGTHIEPTAQGLC
jgi:hypothetical protein